MNTLDVAIAAIGGAIVGSIITGAFSLMLTIVNNRSRAAERAEDRVERAAQRNEDRQDWYRQSLYERRVRVAQEAYSWTWRFNVAITTAKPDDPDDEGTKKLLQLSRDAREWYNANVIWFHDGLPQASSFIGLINAAATYATGRLVPPQGGRSIWDTWRDATEQVRARAEELMDLPFAPLDQD